MSKENQQKLVSKSKTKEENRKLKVNESSDSDSNSESDEENDDTIDIQEYRKFLANMYPSKHMNNKVKAGERLNKIINEDNNKVENNKKVENNTKKVVNNNKKVENTKKIVNNKKAKKVVNNKKAKKVVNNKKTTNNKKKNNNKYISETEDESDYETEDDSDYKTEDAEDDETDESEDDESEDDSDDETEDDSDNETEKAKLGNFNIIFTIGSSKVDNEEENENENSSSDEEDIIDKKELITDKKENNELLELLNSIKKKDEENDLVNECIKVCENKISQNKEKQEKLIKKQKEKNVKNFRKNLTNKNVLNDVEFFNKLELDQQKSILNELKEINKNIRIEKPYRLTLLESNIPTNFKAYALKKINMLRYMEPGSGEYYKIKNWVDTFMRIPFGKYNTLPISINDGVDKCHDFMENAQKTLNDAVYGLNDAKMQIMQMLGHLITNPQAIGTAIAIHGAPGTGKTSIVKEGISKILNRPFAFIALGGATDSSFLEGHSYTYEGSTWGKIVQIIIDCKCMNPVIYFDELDKISDTPKGEEIVGILTHLTDTTQNSQFHDKYFSEIDFDLSKCLFIFSYNDETKVNPILKDRMYRIQTKGYNQNDKLVISKSYLLPKIREQVKFLEEDIIIPDNTMNYIIENYCNKEDGVRNLKRCLEIIYTKLNLFRLMRPESNLFNEDMSLKVEFPFTVTKDIIDKLIKVNKENIGALYSMYI
jgi:ATP-dependent Lon protease